MDRRLSDSSLSGPPSSSGILLQCSSILATISLTNGTEFQARFGTLRGDWTIFFRVDNRSRPSIECMLEETESLYRDIYTAWSELIQDDGILPEWQTMVREHEVISLCLPWRAKFWLSLLGFENYPGIQKCHCLPTEIPFPVKISRADLKVTDYLASFVLPEFDRKLLKDRKLERMTNGDIAIVSSYIEKRDLVFAFKAMR